jgi:DNA polymerase I-like protein with 3'-5' exonuclease and polymerase domains
MIDTFKSGRDIYATISSTAFGVPYEDCLEFNPKTHEYQPEGKARRGVGKVLVLGINYGMSHQAIGEKIYGDDDSITEEEKTQKAKVIYEAAMEGFPDLQRAILGAQYRAAKYGYTETILGRRRHFPILQLPNYEFKPEKGYINPDIDPLNPETFKDKNAIPQRIQDSLLKELNSYKWKGQVFRRIKELSENEHIKVIDNTRKKDETKRQIFNAVIQGSAAELTKMAMLKLETDPEWIGIGGRLIIPVHDELIVEVPFEYREKGAEILKRCMEDAGSFLPFPISCDIEMTFRWYGLEVDDVLSFEEPMDLDYDNMSESNVKWLQSRLFEQGYVMPVFKNEDGSKPIGIAAKGINGKVSDDLKNACTDYMAKFGLTDVKLFFEHINTLVIKGVSENI